MAKTEKNNKQSIITQKDFNLVFRVLKTNWWVPLIVLPIAYVIGLFYVYRLTTVYKASTEFLLKADDTYYKSNVLSEANFLTLPSYIDNSNETRIIQSYDLANKVVEKLMTELQVSYFIVGKVRTTEQFMGMPFQIIVNSVNPGNYEQIIDFRVIDYNQYEITIDRDGKRTTLNGRFDEQLRDLDLSIKVIRSSNFTPETSSAISSIFYQFIIHSKENLVANIRKNLSIENPEYTQILRVELKDVIPERAVLILDTLNSVYAQNRLKSKYDLNERTIEYIDKQIAEIRYSLQSIEDTMQRYKEKSSIIDLSWQQNDFLTKIGAFDNEKSNLQIKLRSLDELEKYIIEDKDPQFLPPSVFVIEKEGYMVEAVKSLWAMQIELNKSANQAKADNPAVIGLTKGIVKTKQDLLIYIGNAKRAQETEISMVSKRINDYVSQVKEIPQKAREIMNIQRQATVSEELYNFLLEKKASTKIARASIVPEFRIVEAPRSVGIDSPDKNKIQKQFLSGGLLLTLIIIILQSFVFAKINSVDYLKDLTTLPLIGALPRLRQGSTGIIVEEEPNSQIAEAFRSFRTNLKYAAITNEARTFLITSFLPGEGKTFTSTNLAVTLSKTGKRTALIELDLHKPTIYKRFNLPAQKTGITTYINGGSTFEEIVSPTSIPNLYCIYSGPVPPNPSEYVLSENMKTMLERIKKEFDYVVIDTPPAGLLSDSVYLIQSADAAIFVLNTKSSTKRVINFVEDLIENNGLKNVMLVLNGVTGNSKRYYYSGYGYSYGYGYGYGYGRGQGYR